MLPLLYFHVIALLLLLGGFAVHRGFVALAAYRRVRREGSRTLVNAEPGPIEVSGTLRVVGDPVHTLRGERAVLVRREVEYSYTTSGSAKTYSSGGVVIDENESAVAELVDERGSNPVLFDHVVLLGQRKGYSFEPKTLAESQPALWAKIQSAAATRRIQALTVWETAVPDGARCFVSGACEPDFSTVPTSDYRGSRQQLRITGSEDRPLLLCVGTEAEALRVLARPALLTFWAAGLCLAAAAALVLAWLRIGAMAGV